MRAMTDFIEGKLKLKVNKAYWLSLGLKSISARYDLQRST